MSVSRLPMKQTIGIGSNIAATGRRSMEIGVRRLPATVSGMALLRSVGTDPARKSPLRVQNDAEIGRRFPKVKEQRRRRLP